jgi:hypothetical protein
MGIEFVMYALFKLGFLVYLTLIFYALPWWPDLDGDLRI